MSLEGASLTEWLASPIGQYLQRWETAQFDEAVSDIFGYHALQLGFTEVDALRNNRMPHQWLAVSSVQAVRPDTAVTGAGPASSRSAALVADASALPFSAASLDLLVLPHTLELSADPHAALREAERVLVPEGRVVITGINPNSLWGFRQSRAHLYRSVCRRFGREVGADGLFMPGTGESMGSIGYWRLRDWLRLLGFEVESARFGVYAPSFASEKWLTRFAWMDTLGPRWWPIFGATYCVVAVKRVRGMRLLEPARRSRKVVAAAPAVVASKDISARHSRGR
jgi:SAM-dependent methyltransferase